MNYRVRVLFVFAALVSFGVATNAVLASEIMQMAGSQPLPPSTYTPPTYTLGAAVNQIHSFDVDEYGRIYVVDSGKRTVFVFNSDGSVASVWRKNQFGGAGHAVFSRIDVVNSELLFFSGTDLETHKSNVIRISPYEPDGISELNDDVFPIHVLGLPDRSYVVDYKQQQIGFMDSDGNNYSTVQHPGPYDTYLTMVGVDRQSNACVYKSDTGVMSVWNRGGLVRQFQLQKEDLGWDFRYWRVTVDSDGVIYACYNGRISRIDTQGRIMSSFSTWCDPSDHRYSNYYTPHVDDLRVTNGIIYATLRRNIIFTARSVTDEIHAYTADGRCIARYFFAKTDFNTPSVLAVQPDGTFAVGQGYIDTSMAGYIVSADGKQFTDMKTGSNFTSLVAAPDNGYYTVDGLFMSKMNSAGDILERIANRGNNMLTSVWPALENRYVWAICPHPPSGGLCVLSGTEVEIDGPQPHIGDWDVRIFDFSGKLLGIVSSLGQSIYDSIAAGRDGSIYATSSNCHGLIQKYDAKGNKVYTLNDRGWQIGQISDVHGMLPDINGNLLVADSGNSRIQVFSPQGKPLGVWGKAGSGQGELAEPRSIAFGPGDTFLIADTDNDRIVRVPRNQFYKELKKTAIPPAEPIMLSKKEPLPKAGPVTLNGIVTADARDGSVYAQHVTGCWGVKLELPKGITVKRGSGYKIVGTLAFASGTNTVKVKSISPIKSIKPCLLSVANAVISRPLNSKSIPDGVMVATWGRVTSVDAAKRTFSIADGSVEGAGITVKCGKAIANAQPTKQGQYVAVTGISLKNTLQIREASDIKHLEQSVPAKTTVARL